MHLGNLFVAFQMWEWALKKQRQNFSRACCDRIRCSGFKLKQNQFKLDIEGGETLAYVVICGRCLIPGNVQRQGGLGSKQPDLVEDVPAHWKITGTR